MSSERDTSVIAVQRALRVAMARDRARPFVLGICGAQGSGKSTLAAALAERMRGEGIRTAILSIDDLYRTRAERAVMAQKVHPLFAVRGVPGTHDVALGLDLIAMLDQHRDVALPRFDKARDDRCPKAAWDMTSGDTELLIFEGWCVGARPEAQQALEDPVNGMEREEDAGGVWRRAVNEALAGDYQKLFARIDMLVLLAAPGFEVVRDWRIEQEHALALIAGEGATQVMSDGEVERFIGHYERLTRHILREMPYRADLVIRLAPDRSPLSIAPGR